MGPESARMLFVGMKAYSLFWSSMRTVPTTSVRWKIGSSTISPASLPLASQSWDDVFGRTCSSLFSDWDSTGPVSLCGDAFSVDELAHCAISRAICFYGKIFRSAFLSALFAATT